MSGLIAVLSGDLGAAAWGRAALGYLRHRPAYSQGECAAPGLWLGACGRPGSWSIRGAGAIGGLNAVAGPGLLVAVCGDILGRGALARRLSLPDAVSDAGLVAAAYERWDRRLLEHLEGAFALIVHDASCGRTLASCDPDAVMQLYSLRVGDDLLFATEAKAFLGYGRFSVSVDEQALADLVSLGHGFGGRTLFAGVSGLPHGSHYEVDAGVCSVVRHWDVRCALGDDLRGDAYLDRMEVAIRELSAAAMAGEDVLLPLTGGVDSRMIAAAAPGDAHPLSFTFGTGEDPDSVRGRQIAAARGLEHHVYGLAPDYLAETASATVWLTEGRLNPDENISGHLMAGMDRHKCFVTGIGGDLGRRYYKNRLLLPDWTLVRAGDREFERRFLLGEPTYYGMPIEDARLVFGPRADDYSAAALADLRRQLLPTRGLPAVDRLDLYSALEATPRAENPQLIAGTCWLGVRAPLLTRRWIEAVLAGAADQRVDDLVRLRLIRRLDPAVARVPWGLTRLPLRASETILRTLRLVAGLHVRARPHDEGPAFPFPRLSRFVDKVHSQIYWHAEEHEEWLRSRSGGYVTEVLLSERTALRGLMRREGLKTLLEQHMRGTDHSHSLGQALNIELWHRHFVDGELPLLPSAPPAPDGYRRQRA